MNAHTQGPSNVHTHTVVYVTPPQCTANVYQQRFATHWIRTTGLFAEENREKFLIITPTSQFLANQGTKNRSVKKWSYFSYSIKFNAHSPTREVFGYYKENHVIDMT